MQRTATCVLLGLLNLSHASALFCQCCGPVLSRGPATNSVDLLATGKWGIWATLPEGGGGAVKATSPVLSCFKVFLCRVMQVLYTRDAF